MWMIWVTMRNTQNLSRRPNIMEYGPDDKEKKRWNRK